MNALILLENDFEDAEFLYPYYRLQEAGFNVKVVGLGEKTYHGKHGYVFSVDGSITDVKNQLFDALVIPGGRAPDRLRRNQDVLALVKRHADTGKIVAAICHGPWVLISAGVLKRRRITCVPAIKDDVINAGALYEDKEVVVDGNLITSRKPTDLPAFSREILKALGRL